MVPLMLMFITIFVDEEATHVAEVMLGKLTPLGTSLLVNCATSLTTLSLNVGTGLMRILNMLITSLTPKDQLATP